MVENLQFSLLHICFDYIYVMKNVNLTTNLSSICGFYRFKKAANSFIFITVERYVGTKWNFILSIMKDLEGQLYKQTIQMGWFWIKHTCMVKEWI